MQPRPPIGLFPKIGYHYEWSTGRLLRAVFFPEDFLGVRPAGPTCLLLRPLLRNWCDGTNQAKNSEHAVGHSPKVGALLLEALCQPIVVFIHLSHSPVAWCHCSSDEPNPADVTRRPRCDREIKTETAVFITPVQRRHLSP